MATKKQTETAEAKGSIGLKPINRKIYRIRIIGRSPLIQHSWSEKAKKEMRDKHGGKKTKTRDKRDPEQEGKDAAYYTADGKYGIPAMAIKSAMVTAAHKDIGLEKTLVKKALFIYPSVPNLILPMECDEPEIREDNVRVGQGSADLRYRPYFYKWSLEMAWEIDADLLQLADFLTLMDRAGFGVGIGEWRPEKGGENGRFEIDRSFPITEEGIE